MKHRWLIGLLLSTVLALGACTPAEGGEAADESAQAPADFYEGY
jgi:hypothetical protein